jgi:two-component system response regulator VicR
MAGGDRAPAKRLQRRVLIVEDDPSIGRVLRDNLTLDGLDVEWVADGSAALQSARTRVPDLVLLDLMLPGQTGFELFGALRRTGKTAIIVVTALSDKKNKLHGFDLGADDYITKPFDLEELLARVHSVLRRVSAGTDRIRLGDVSVDFGRRTVSAPRRTIHLTHQEFELLSYLAAKRGQVVSREELLHQVWGYVDLPLTRSVDFAILRLRKKIEIDPGRRFIHTAHGGGYYLTADEPLWERPASR